MPIIINRRRLLAAGGAIGAVTMLPGMAFAAAATRKRLVFVIQRGAADGLAIVQPVGEPALTGLRSALIEPDTVRLNEMFGLHPSLANTASLFASGEARAFHAVATRYRDRSHFDGQNVLESGSAQPYALQTGWLGRLLSLLPPAEASAIALAPAVPLALRGDAPVGTFSPNRLASASDDLMGRVSMLYEQDSQLAPLWAEALKTRLLAADIAGNAGRNGGDLGKLAASLLAPPDGARVMMIETGGWDTHSGQKARLSAQLRGLDRLLAELKLGLAAAWADTLVLVATEFGRTAAANGTGGTDHGTGSVALIAGGGLPGGRTVEADWPGLAPSALLENRDLRPTAALGRIITTELARHYGLDPQRLGQLFV